MLIYRYINTSLLLSIPSTMQYCSAAVQLLLAVRPGVHLEPSLTCS